jgi:tetratricopeptide (TPR) repeat protein
LSAWEFEHAIKEMPDRAEPVNNLGLVYEAVGKMGEAIIQYQNARLIDPENSQYLGNLLRARIRQGEHPSIMRTELQTLIELDPRKEWVQWAKLQLTTDRTMQDWRHPSVGLTNELPVESNHAESLSFEPVPAGVEITTSDELPVFQLPAETGDKLELETGRQ